MVIGPLSPAEAPARYPYKNSKKRKKKKKTRTGDGAHFAPRALFFFLSSLPSPQHKESSVEGRGNGTLLSFEWLTQSDDRVAEVWFVLITGWIYRPELDDTKHCYQLLIITITKIVII